ncbi:MAG: conjugal transfer protein TraF [Candidatus Margulisbacteria bacterium]|nr:conjugal transfer protein TraF [Candidatus Margulisiibacteriota bacterium]
MRLKNIIFSLVCLGAFSFGSTAGSFLENAISARAMALGNAGAALDDSSAAYLNPAAIKLSRAGQTYQAMQGKVLNEINYFAFNYGLTNSAFFDLGLGFSFLNSGVEGIQAATYDNNTGTAAYTGEEFGYSGQAYIFTLGRSMFQDLYLGANLKAVRENLYEQTSSGAGLDLGLIWQKGKFTLGLSLINLIAPNLSWSEGWRESLNPKALFSLAYQVLRNWTVYSDITQDGERPVYFGLGTEITLFDTVALRAGWNPDQLSAGTGFNFKGLAIDYAFLISSEADVGSSQYISIAYLLDTNKELDRLSAEERRRKQMQDMIEAEKQRKEIQPVEDWTTALEQPAQIDDIFAASSAAQPVIEDWTSLFDEPTSTILPVEIARPAEIMLEPTPDAEIFTSESPAAEPLEIISAPAAALIELEPTAAPVEFAELPVEAVYDYQIALMASRYFYQSNRLQTSVYLDNLGNQPLTINATFKIVDSRGKTIYENNSIEQIIPVEATEVIRLNYTEPMSDGVYSLEFNATSTKGTLYKKENFIKNSDQ